jgi:hypothetical protein
LNRRRWAILSAEAAVLGLVIAVVYLTLLRPDGDNQLFDVDVPSDGQRTAQGPSPGDRDRGEPAGGGGIDAGERASTRGGRPPFGPSQAPPPGAGESPTADQYLDTLARLNARVNAAYD